MVPTVKLLDKIKVNRTGVKIFTMNTLNIEK